MLKEKTITQEIKMRRRAKAAYKLCNDLRMLRLFVAATHEASKEKRLCEKNFVGMQGNRR